MRLKNKNVLVYGLGDSGRAVIKILQKHNAHVSFYDENPRFWDYVGYERNPMDKQYDFVILSPGIKVLGNALLENFKERKVPVYSELDFAYLLSKGRIIAITGTNGKTTVSMLVNRILKEAGLSTFLCGNIGLPFSAVCEKTTKETVVVCEVSNFQLETSRFFHPSVACILNIKPDHLDRHESFEEYVRVKEKISQKMKGKDLLVLNLDDEVSRGLCGHKKRLYFSKKVLKKGVFVKNEAIFYGKKKFLNLSDIPLRGEKNLENVLASVAICSVFKVDEESLKTAVSSFSLASHRMEIVGSVNGITFVDDSKATNVASTVACVEAFANERIVLLLGGKGKEIEYDEIFSSGYPIKEVICFGEDRENIFACARKHDCHVTVFEKFDEAVKYSISNSQSGDYVLLSPACSSFDEFSSYAERGERFKTLVVGSAQ